MRPRIIHLVARRELREAVRGRWFLLAAGSFFVLSMALAWLGLAGGQRSGLAGFDRTTASLLNLMLVFVPLVTLSLGSLGIAGELEDGALGLLLSQPLTRAEVYFGKYLGLYVAIAAAVLLGFGGTGVLVGVVRGGDPGLFLRLLGLTLVLAAATLALGTAISAALPRRSRVIGVAFALWLALVYLSDLGTIGLTIARNLGPGQVFLLALFNPVQEARILGVLALAGRPELLGPAGLWAQDNLGVTGMIGALLLGLAAAVIGPLLLGLGLFRKVVVP